MRRLVATLGLALAALGVPVTASAQSYCGGGNGGYSLFAPTGYSAYGGFASFPGGFTSGAVPNNYSSNLYNGCGSAGSAASQPYTYTGNTYNPYSGYAACRQRHLRLQPGGHGGHLRGLWRGSPGTSGYGGSDPSSCPGYSASAYGTNPAYGTPANARDRQRLCHGAELRQRVRDEPELRRQPELRHDRWLLHPWVRLVELRRLQRLEHWLELRPQRAQSAPAPTRRHRPGRLATRASPATLAASARGTAWRRRRPATARAATARATTAPAATARATTAAAATVPAVTVRARPSRCPPRC